MSAKRPMSPEAYAVGLTLTLVLSIAFYSWLLYAVLKVPVKWVAIVMAGTSAALTVSAVYGYRLWYWRNYGSDSKADTASIRLGPLVLFLWGATLLAAGSLYLLLRGATTTAVTLALVLGGLSYYVSRRGFAALRRRQAAFGSDRPAEGSAPDIPDAADLARAVMLVIAPVWVAGVGIGVMREGHEGMGGFLLLVALLSVPWALRRARAFSRRRP